MIRFLFLQDVTFTSTVLNNIIEENDLLEDSTELINEDSTDQYESITSGITGEVDTEQEKESRMNMVSKLLRIVETQAAQGSDCTPGEGLNMGEKVVSRYAQVCCTLFSSLDQTFPGHLLF